MYPIINPEGEPESPLNKDNWTNEDTIKAQLEDQFISKLINSIKNIDNLSDKLRSKIRKNFILKDNILYKISKKFGWRKTPYRNPYKMDSTNPIPGTRRIYLRTFRYKKNRIPYNKLFLLGQNVLRYRKLCQKLSCLPN